MTTPLITLCLLLIPGLVLRLFNAAAVDRSAGWAWGLGLAFAFFSLGHFVKTDGMVAMLPTWVPGRLPLVWTTGVLEAMVAAGLFTRRLRSLAAVAALVMLVAFFPVNVYAAVNGFGLGGHQWGPAYLWVRAPLQGLLLFCGTRVLLASRSARVTTLLHWRKFHDDPAA